MMDGLYISEMQEIIGIQFIGESNLIVILEGADGESKESKMLYSTKFYPGDYKFLEDDYKKDSKQSYRQKLELIQQMVKHSELESSFDFTIDGV